MAALDVNTTSNEVGEEESELLGTKLAPFNPSMPYVVEAALAMLQLSNEDVLYDLGCGDGRVMIAAALATPGLRCIGIEYDSKYAARAQEAVAAAGLTERVTVHHANVLDVSIADATAAFVYLVPKGMVLVAPALQKLIARGGRVVTYVFSMPDATPTQVEMAKGTKIYRYGEQRKQQLCDGKAAENTGATEVHTNQ